MDNKYCPMCHYIANCPILWIKHFVKNHVEILHLLNKAKKFYDDFQIIITKNKLDDMTNQYYKNISQILKQMNDHYIELDNAQINKHTPMNYPYCDRYYTSIDIIKFYNHIDSLLFFHNGKSNTI